MTTVLVTVAGRATSPYEGIGAKKLLFAVDQGVS